MGYAHREKAMSGHSKKAAIGAGEVPQEVKQVWGPEFKLQYCPPTPAEKKIGSY
jgi:hypothetical protein